MEKKNFMFSALFNIFFFCFDFFIFFPRIRVNKLLLYPNLIYFLIMLISHNLKSQKLLIKITKSLKNQYQRADDQLKLSNEALIHLDTFFWQIKKEEIYSIQIKTIYQDNQQRQWLVPVRHMIYVFLTMTQFQIVSIKSNSIINKIMLKEIKHRKKVIINRSNKMQLQLNDCETEYIQKTQFLKKKVHLLQNKQTLRQPNQYQQIGMLPEYKLTIHQMNEDPISLVMRLQQKYRDYGAVKLVPPMEWNPPFQFKYTEKLITTRIQKIHRLIDGKVSLFHRQVP